MTQIGVKHVIAPAAVDLQITLRHAFVFVTAFFQHRPRGGIFRQAGAFDAAEVQRAKGEMHRRQHRLAHVPLLDMGRAKPVAQRPCLRRAAPDIVQRHRPKQHLVRPPDQQQRQRRALSLGPPGPVNPVGKGAARQVVMRPDRLPRRQMRRRGHPQFGPGPPIGMVGQTQGQPLGFDRGALFDPKHQPRSL